MLAPWVLLASWMLYVGLFKNLDDEGPKHPLLGLIPLLFFGGFLWFGEWVFRTVAPHKVRPLKRLWIPLYLVMPFLEYGLITAFQ
jgi:hypothetical protein